LFHARLKGFEKAVNNSKPFVAKGRVSKTELISSKLKTREFKKRLPQISLFWISGITVI